MAGGYRGRILNVNLGSGRISKQPLDFDMARNFIGDFGVNLRLAYDLIEPGIEPLSPGNAIVFGAGPLVGTSIQAPRWTAASKLPLTNAIACCSAGMGFGTRMKRAGYDHLVVTGRAPNPVYLRISDDEVELCGAEPLWGKDIFQTTDTLWDTLGKDWSVTAIGQAGENRVKIALAIVDKHSSLGKGGLAAVMASKNLKAVAVRGTGRVPVADEDRWHELSGRYAKLYKDDPERETWRRLGKMHMWDVHMTMGIPYKNWTELYPLEKANELFGVDAFFRHFKKRLGCTGCVYQCKDAMEVREGEHKGLVTYLASTTGHPINLGIRFGIESYDQMLKLADLCARFGLCSHTFSAVADFAIELFERGMITVQDTGGLVLKRDFQTAVELARLTAFREGIGDVLADGSPGLIGGFGKECEQYSLHVKGLDQQTDGRLRQFNLAGFGQVVNPEGANIEPGHVGSGFRPSKPSFSRGTIEAYARRMDIPQASLDRIVDVKTFYNSARLLPYAEDFYVLLTSLGICEYRTHFYDWGRLGELYSAATGWQVTTEDMKLAGERIWNLYKAINVREGFDRRDDRIPARWLEPVRNVDGTEIPLVDCAGETVTPDSLHGLLDDYYDERGWSVTRGIPTRDKLEALGLGSIARDLIGSGLL